MECFDSKRGTYIILFLIFEAWYSIGTAINLSTSCLYNVWFYSCCFSNHTDCCSAGFSPYFNAVHRSHVLILFCMLCSVTTIILLHQFKLHFQCPKLWKAPHSCESVAAIKHPTPFKPLLLGKSSFTPLYIHVIQTYMQRLPGISAFVYFVHSKARHGTSERMNPLCLLPQTSSVPPTVLYYYYLATKTMVNKLKLDLKLVQVNVFSS